MFLLGASLHKLFIVIMICVEQLELGSAHLSLNVLATEAHLLYRAPAHCLADGKLKSTESSENQ